MLRMQLGHIDSLVKGSIVNLPENISLEEGTFLLLAKEATAWVDSSEVTAGDQVVVLGQGVVGSLVMQLLRGYQPQQIYYGWRTSFALPTFSAGSR